MLLLIWIRSTLFPSISSNSKTTFVTVNLLNWNRIDYSMKNSKTTFVTVNHNYGVIILLGDSNSKTTFVTVNLNHLVT